MAKHDFTFHDESAKAPRRADPLMDLAPGGARMDIPGGAPYMPDGAYNWGFYDAVSFSTNRAARPYFATDSRFTLTQWARLRALALARWAYINVPVVKGAVDLNARLTVGTGFSPKTHMADKKLAAAADEYYLEQVKDIGFANNASMDELLIHDSRCVDVDGDCGYILTSDEFDQPKIQLIESHRIKTGEVNNDRCRDGVWIDQYARRVAYNVSVPNDNPYDGADKTRRIEAKDFVYLCEHNRPDELRCMTNLIHALAPIQDLYEILGFATLSAKKNAEYAAVIETPDPANPPLGPTFNQLRRTRTAAAGDQPAIPRQSVTFEQVYGGGGKIPVLKPGEQFKSWTHAQPAETIKSWSEFIIRGISVGFGQPFEILWNPEKIGGANTRLITALCKQRIQQRRQFLVYPKLTRVRYWILSRGVKRGDLKPGDYTRVEWRPNFVDITVDAGRESKERRENVLAGTDNYSGYYAENGENYLDEQLPVRQADVDAQCAAANALIAKYPKLSFIDALNRVAAIGTITTRSAETEVPAAGAPAAGSKVGAINRAFKIQREDGSTLEGEITDKPNREFRIKNPDGTETVGEC